MHAVAIRAFPVRLTVHLIGMNSFGRFSHIMRHIMRHIILKNSYKVLEKEVFEFSVKRPVSTTSEAENVPTYR